MAKKKKTKLSSMAKAAGISVKDVKKVLKKADAAATTGRQRYEQRLKNQGASSAAVKRHMGRVDKVAAGKTSNKATAKSSSHEKLLKSAQSAAQSGKWKPGQTLVIKGGVIGKSGSVFPADKYGTERALKTKVSAPIKPLSKEAAKGRIADMALAGGISEKQVKKMLREAGGEGGGGGGRSAAAKKAWATRKAGKGDTGWRTIKGRKIKITGKKK